MPTYRPLLDLSKPVTAGEALAALEAAAPKWEISSSALRAIRSNVVTTLEYATRKSGVELMAEPINGLLPDLAKVYAKPAHAHTAAPSDAAGRVRRFVRIVADREFDTNRVETPERFIDPAHQPLVECCKEAKVQLSNLARFLRVAHHASDREGLRVMPPLDRIAESAALLEVNGDSLSRAENSYRRARAVLLKREPLAADRYAELPDRPSARLSRLAHVLGSTERDTMKLLAGQAPTLARQVAKFAESGVERRKQAKVSDAFARTVRTQMTGAVASMVEHGDTELTPAFAAVDLLEKMRRIPVTAVGVSADDDPFDIGDSGKEPTVEVTLLEVLVERTAARARAEGRMPEGATYCDGCHQMVVAAGSLIFWGYAEKLKAVDTVRLETLRVRYAALYSKVVMGMADAPAKNKERLIETVTYPMVVCLILPYLRRVAAKAKTAYESAAADARQKGHLDPLKLVEVRKLRDSWGDALLDYLTLGFPIEDGLRDKNYRRGRWGRHFLPRTGADGKLEIWTRFTRERDDEASRKDRMSKGKKPVRKRRMRAGIVDPALVMDYVTEFRVDALVASGRIPSRAAYDAKTDLAEARWALFVSPKRVTRADQSYAPKASTQRFGRVLNRTCRELLGRGVPEYGTGGKEWRGLWAKHSSRLLLATFIGGVLGHWDLAEMLTDDKVTTLKAEYTAVDHVIEEALKGEVTWEHPEAFVTMWERLYKHSEVFDPLDELQALDGDARKVMLPDPLRGLLRAESAAAAPVAKRRRRHQGPKFRKPRPGQPQPSYGKRSIKVLA